MCHQTWRKLPTFTWNEGADGLTADGWNYATVDGTTRCTTSRTCNTDVDDISTCAPWPALDCPQCVAAGRIGTSDGTPAVFEISVASGENGLPLGSHGYCSLGSSWLSGWSGPHVTGSGTSGDGGPPADYEERFFPEHAYQLPLCQRSPPQLASLSADPAQELVVAHGAPLFAWRTAETEWSGNFLPCNAA